MKKTIRQAYGNIRKNKLLRKYFPIQRVQIEVTTFCNLKCKGCYHNLKEYSGKNKHMPLEDFKNYIDQLPKADDLQLYGIGEPIIHPDIVEMTRYAKKSNKFNSIIISTNCLAGKPSIFDELFSKGLDRIIISVDSLDQKEADELRAGTNVKQLKNNVKYLLDKYPDKIRFAIVISKRNMNTIEVTIKILDNMGAKYIELSPFSNMGDLEHLCLSFKEKTDFSKWAEKISTKNAKIAIGAYFKPTDQPCRIIFKRAVISVDGYVVPCCTELNEEAIAFGNLKETSFDELFFSNKSNLLQAGIEKGKYPSICKGCMGNHTEFNSHVWNLKTGKM